MIVELYLSQWNLPSLPHQAVLGQLPRRQLPRQTTAQVDNFPVKTTVKKFVKKLSGYFVNK